MPLPQSQQREVRFTANLADAYYLSRIADNVRDRLGSPYLDWQLALRFALSITSRVIDAGELERFREMTSGPVPRTLPE